jgi:hypothetical protein
MVLLQAREGSLDAIPQMLPGSFERATDRRLSRVTLAKEPLPRRPVHVIQCDVMQRFCQFAAQDRQHFPLPFVPCLHG